MAYVIRAHYDGTNIVPDEPVNLPVNESIEVELRLPYGNLNNKEVAKRRDAISRFASYAVKRPEVADEKFGREDIYEPPRGI